MPVSNPPAGQVVEPASVGSGITGLLSSPDLSVGPGVRGWLESGGIDPRAVSVLGGALGRFSVGVGGVDVVDSPAGAQVLDIVSVDGEPVGPQNFAARELVGWLAGLQPGVRPDEIGSPWSIHSPGFFSDGSSTASIRLVFDLPSSGTTPPTGTPIDAAESAPAGSASGGPQAHTPANPPGSGSVAQVASETPSAGVPVDPATTEKVGAMVKQADALVGLPYVWGGGHEGWGPQAGYDCSGFVSKVLHAGGFLSEPVTTDNLVGQPGIVSGPGRFITVYDRAHPVTGQSEGHVIISIDGQFYESGGQHGAWGGGGGVEKIGRPSASYLATFTNVLHPEGL